MPTLGESLGLGTIASWLSGSSKTNKDAVSGTLTPKEAADPNRLETTTTWSQMVNGKTFEQAMAVVMAGIPPSPTDVEEKDKLADALKASTLSEKAPSTIEADGYIHIENSEEPSPADADLQNSSDLTLGRLDCDKVYAKENAIKQIMEVAGSLGLGSTEYFDAISHVYNLSPSQIAHGNFLKGLIKRLHQGKWVALDPEKEGGFKVVDYGAGTGILSHALAPYVTEILAIDKSAKMVEEYNKIVVKENKTECEMKAVQGDMISHFLSGKRVGIEEPNGISAGFDMVAMCLTIDFFTHEDVDDYTKHKELVRALDVMVNLIQVNGSLLIVDVEKCDDDCSQGTGSRSPGSRQEGLKVTGHGSKDIQKALEELGMEDITVLVDENFLFEAKRGSGPHSPVLRREETYFVLIAKRGPMFEERLSQRP